MSPSPFQLLVEGRYQELVALLRDPVARGTFLQEAAAFAGPANGMPANTPASLADRQQHMIASGDWSWGLLSSAERRKLLVRDASLLKGAGVADQGKAQLGALKRLQDELPHLYESLDVALNEDDLEWLLPLAEHLNPVLDIVSEHKEMHQRYKVLLEAARRMGSPKLEFYAQHGLAKAQYNLANFDNARLAGQAARELGLRLGDRRGEAAALSNLGLVEWKQGNIGEARGLFAEALAIQRELDDRYCQAASLNNLGLLEQNQGNLSAARGLYGQALALNREIGNRHYEATNTANLGTVEWAQGDFSAARELYAKALVIHRELGNRNGEALALNSLALVEHQQGNSSTERELNAQGLAIQRELGDRWGEAYSLNGIGVAEYCQGNLSSAREAYGQALALRRELGDRLGEVFSLGCLGVLEWMQGNYRAAQELFAEELAICRELGNRQSEAIALSNLGVVEYSLNNYSGARDRYAEALTIRLEVGDKAGIAYSGAYSAPLLARLGRLREAALVLHGAQKRAAEIALVFEIDARLALDAGLARLDAAVASGEITAEQLIQLEVESEALSFDDLAKFMLKALTEANTVLSPDADTSEDKPTA